jgi:thioredoxin reductase (NADPH)
VLDFFFCLWYTLFKEKIMVDCIIIGSGVAGISAGLTLKANGKTFLLFGSNALSEKIEKAELIRNYPGLTAVSGKAFLTALQEQLAKEEIVIQEEKVAGVYALNGKFGVATQQGGYYESACVILASGVESVKTIEGETQFIGRGVSVCATCDGFLYKGKTIGVICTSKRLEHEIEHLASFAKKVYLIAMYKDVSIANENVEIIRKMPKKIDGNMRVEKLVFADQELSVDGVFSLRESMSANTLIDGLMMQDHHVSVARDMQTSIPGLFAAGDCTGRPYQYAKAVGEGNVAAHSVTAYLANKNTQEKV